MQVDVFIAPVESAQRDTMLVLPTIPRGIGLPKFDEQWEFFATLDSSDAMFRLASIDADISEQGYSMFIAIEHRFY